MNSTRMILAALLAGAASPAIAQDTPAFRVPLQGQASTPTATATMSWVEDLSSCSTTCGTGTRTKSYQCQDVTQFDFTAGNFGPAEPEAQCVSEVGPKPSSQTMSCTVYSGCNYDWVKPAEVVTPIAINPFPVGRAGCGQVRREFTPYCERSDGTQLAAGDHAFCSNDLPDYNDVAAGSPGALGYDNTGIETAACNVSDHHWDIGAWGPSSSTCSTTSFKTRPVTCTRNFDGSTQADGECSTPKPATTKTEPDYSTCSYSAAFSPWGAWDSNCSTTAERTRTVQCMRSNGDAVPLSECTSRGVSVTPTSEVQARYGSCTYSRTNPSAWGPWASGCATSTTRTRTYQCLRSNGDIVADSECTSRGVSLVETGTGSNYASCTYSWNAGSWSGWDSTCSTTANRTRSVTCLRSNGDTVADANCSGTKPATSQTQAVYSSCTYSWNSGSWSAWDSTCSTTANRTRSVVCRRSNGDTVPDANCTASKPAMSQTQAVYSSCSYAWVTSGWSGWDSNCSTTASRTRTVTCRRSNGDTVADSNCSGAKPSSTETGARYGSCTYSWNTGSWGAWDSTCSNTASRTRSVTCRRSNGDTVADANCTSAKPATSDTQGVYSSCSYSWNTGAWSAWDSTCSTTATRTRSVNCRRSTGDTVPDANCTTAKPATSSTQAVYGGCSYAWETSGWSPWSSTCSSSAVRTRSVTCRRSNGDTVADGNCTGTKPASSDAQAVYSGCSYSWNTSAWGAWDSTCSSSATRTRSVTCRRSDGTTVGDANCTAPKPSGTNTQAVYSGCSYSWNTSAWGAWDSTCSATATRTRSVNCRRSDGTNVGDANCTASKPASSDTQAIYSGCSYSWNTGAWSAWDSTCSSSAKRTRSVVCKSGSGATVADSNCTDPKPGATNIQAVYSGCSYSWNTGAWSAWSSTCSSSAVRTRSVSCRRSDGTTVADGNCSGAKPAASDAQAIYSGCTYTGSYTAAGACESGTRSGTLTSCTRSDGTSVSTSTCESNGVPSTKSESCTKGGGAELLRDIYGGTGQFCPEDKVWVYGSPSYPWDCERIGAYYAERKGLSCEATRDPYGEPFEYQAELICKEY